MRFEQWAHNPTCEANTLSAVHNVRMAHVVAAEGGTPSFGQSPFAIARGDAFERQLFRNEAARLLPDLVRTGVLADGAEGFLDLRIRANGGSRLRSLDEAIEETTRLLRDTASGSRPRSTPAVVSGATVVIPRGVMLPEAVLIIDVLAIRADTHPPLLQVGEIKTYPDRGGHTDAGDLALARAQAGIYVEALRLAVAREGLTDDLAVSDRGFLVLSRPGSDFPSVRAAEELGWQAERAARGFQLLEAAAQALDPIDWEHTTDEMLLGAVSSAGTSYGEACLSFCDRVDLCHQRALDSGSAAVLGADVHRFVGDIPLPRVRELLAGAIPANAAEHDLVRRVQEAVPWQR
jgi:hypothetical protein